MRHATKSVAIILATGAVIGATLVGAAVLPATAVTTTTWGTFAPLAGVSGNQTTRLTLDVGGFPAASVTTNARTRNAGTISGDSTWLPPGTPIGAKYGTSRCETYLNLPDQPTGAPSTTTYTFDAATPASGWAFALGDIDADAVRVSATTATGATATVDQLGYRGGFNYCAPGVTGKPSCTGVATDIPNWDATTATLTGNAAATDTSGSSAWFEPSASLRTLTFTFTNRSGSPIYQTWFAGLARDIGGTVATADTPAAPVAGAEVTLRGPAGTVLETTTSAADGTYAFPRYAAAAGYTVAVAVPDGYTASGPVSRPVDLTSADATAVDFAVAAIAAGSVAGTVVDDSTSGVAGVEVAIERTDGPFTGETTRSGPAGGFVFDELPVGDYTVEISAPAGFDVVGAAERDIRIDQPDTAVSGVTFTLAAVVVEPTSTPTPTPEPTATPNPTASPAPTATASATAVPIAPGTPGTSPGTPPTGTNGFLPDTGADGQALLWWGGGALVALLIGSFVIARSARRARTRRDDDQAD